MEKSVVFIRRLLVAIKYRKPLYTVGECGLLKSSLCPECNRIGRLWDGGTTECLFCGYKGDSKEFFN